MELVQGACYWVLFLLDCDQTQLMVEVPAISYFAIPTDGKGVLVWFHFLLSAGLLLTGYC